MWKRLKAIGPGALIAAAFIGPGTVTTATAAGAQFGYTLAWALVFATIAAIILQEMSVRLGVVARLGLGEAVLKTLGANPVLRWLLIGLIIAALFVGNAAYEGGNIAGAALGLETLFDGAVPHDVLAGATAIMAAGMLFLGGYRAIEKFLIAIVLLMSITFAAALFIIGPDLTSLAKGALHPRIPDGALPIVIGLIGTTIVPYNLFLHAAAARRRWKNATDLPEARFDATISIGLGGLVSILILSTAAASLFAAGLKMETGADMTRQLEPAFGPWAGYLLSTGLFAAGLSSAITAPLATGFATSELFGFKSDPKAFPFRMIAGAVLGIGTALAIFGVKPIQVILFAQIANGFLLPIIAVFLLYAANQHALLGSKANGFLANLAGGMVVVITAGLGVRAILRVLGIL